MNEPQSPFSPSSSSPQVRGEQLTIDSVVKRYGDFTAVDAISLNVPAGSLLTLLGPSGCGKSTLLRMIAGFVAADHGAISLGGRDILDVPPSKRDVAMVFQSYALFPHMTILENVMFGLKMRRVPKRQARSDAMDALELVKLAELAERYPSQLSGGQQQRAALARALVTNPKVLLLDEPFGALDKDLRDQMQLELKKLQKSVGVTTICVTHDQREAMIISDYIAVMQHGRVVQFGAPLDIYDAPKNRFVADFVGSSNSVTGRIGKIDSRVAECILENGDRLVVPTSANFASGQTVELAIRANAIRLSPEAHRTISPEGTDTAPSASSPSAILAGVVAFSINLGDMVRYEVRLSAGRYFVVEIERRPGESMIPNGTSVDVIIAAQSCTVLEA
ncbi:MAG: ABC transporter ATP-binding protein [Pandoraea sp.]|nr:ABC transporter ATP-binding protein [Pandoraea sp.]MDR3399295.1 ABC transporter ATP-binding protein [Pandoraea sp.]